MNCRVEIRKQFSGSSFLVSMNYFEDEQSI